MNKWVKRKWVRALRSGEYSKGAGALKREDGYCCLGVLAEEMAPEFVKPTGDSWWAVAVGGEEGLLPDDLAILWGVSNEDQVALAKVNDYADTFEPVIAYIEENL